MADLDARRSGPEVTGRELFHHDNSNKLTSVPIQATGGFDAGKSVKILNRLYWGSSATGGSGAGAPKAKVWPAAAPMRSDDDAGS